jgi:hypothetical protein
MRSVSSEVGDIFQLPRAVEAKSPPDRERIRRSSALRNFIGLPNFAPDAVLAANASTGGNGFLVLQAAFSDAYCHSSLSFTFVKFLLDG